MRHSQIEFRIEKRTGMVEFTVKGVKGTNCEKLARVLKTMGNAVSEQKTSEYFERSATVQIDPRASSRD